MCKYVFSSFVPSHAFRHPVERVYALGTVVRAQTHRPGQPSRFESDPCSVGLRTFESLRAGMASNKCAQRDPQPAPSIAFTIDLWKYSFFAFEIQRVIEKETCLFLPLALTHTRPPQPPFLLTATHRMLFFFLHTGAICCSQKILRVRTKNHSRRSYRERVPQTTPPRITVTWRRFWSTVGTTRQRSSLSTHRMCPRAPCVGCP